MDFLSNFKKKEIKELYNSNNIKITNIDGTDIIEEPDKVVILPYYVSKRGILLRYENIQAFESKQKGVLHYLTVLTSNVENDDVKGTVIKSLIDVYGIKLYNEDITITNPIFITNTQSSKVYFVFVNLYDGKYEEIVVSDFKQLEFKDKNAFVSLDSLNNTIIYDLLSTYSLNMFKKDIVLI